jgi:hypothetical protein
MIKLSISEKTSVDITTIEIMLVNWRTSPENSIIGLNAIMVTNTEATSGFNTICVARMAASAPCCPRSARSYTASPTMMASSTMMPSTSRKPNTLMKLSETPT